MSNKCLIVFVLLITIAIAAHSQDIRIVRGDIVSESMEPFAGATIIADNGEHFSPDINGHFEIRISTQCKKLTFSANGYKDVERSIDGSYLRVKMVLDYIAIKEREREIQAKKELARKDSLSSVHKAAKEAEELALAKKRTEKKAIRIKKEEAYNERYKNKGFEHNFIISYAFPLKPAIIEYTYSGRRQYETLHPSELDYALTYKISRLLSFGGGAGFLLNAKSISIINDTFSSNMGDFVEKRQDIPIFGTVIVTPLRNRFRLLLEGSFGYYLLSHTIMWSTDFGFEYRLSASSAIHICASCRYVPYPNYDIVQNIAMYKSSLSPAIIIGYSFQ